MNKTGHNAEQPSRGNNISECALSETRPPVVYTGPHTARFILSYCSCHFFHKLIPQYKSWNNSLYQECSSTSSHVKAILNPSQNYSQQPSGHQSGPLCSWNVYEDSSVLWNNHSIISAWGSIDRKAAILTITTIVRDLDPAPQPFWSPFKAVLVYQHVTEM